MTPTPDATCFGRVGLLEFGPFKLPELVELATSRALPEELEIRFNDEELWWSWLRIAASAQGNATSPLGCLGNWFSRVGDAVAGPSTIIDVSRQLLSRELPSTAAIQIGDGPWQPVTDLLVPVEAVVATAANEQTEPPAISGCAEPTELDPVMAAAERQKAELESWLTKSMPQRAITIVISTRPPAKPLDDVIAEAMGRAVVEMDNAARTLSYPWMWGSFAAMVLVSLVIMRSQPRGPDQLELSSLRKLKSALEAIRAVRASQPDEATWNEFGRSLQEELDEVKSELEQGKRADTPIKESLYWALEYRLPRILAEGRLKPSSSEREFQANLNEAERHLRPGAR